MAATSGVINTNTSAEEGSRNEYQLEEGALTVAVPVLVVATMTAFIFGYEIGISGGVSRMKSFWEAFFPSLSRSSDNRGDPFSQFDDPVLSSFTSSLFAGAVPAWLSAPKLSRQFGLRTPMVCACLCFVAGASLQAAATAFWMLVLGRVLQGLGTGLSFHVMPLYVSEMTPLKHQSRLAYFHGVTWLGFFAATLVNVATHGAAGYGWRIALGGAVVPALVALIFVCCLTVETPHSLMEKGDIERAYIFLRFLRPSTLTDAEITAELWQMKDNLESATKRPWRALMMERKFRPHLVATVVLPLFQQLTGINVLALFSPIIFKQVRQGESASLCYAMVGAFVALLLFFYAYYLSKVWDRGNPLLSSSVAMLIFQVGAACVRGWLFGSSTSTQTTTRSSTDDALTQMVVVPCVVVLLGLHAFAGHMGWLLLNESVPSEVRSASQQLSVSTALISSAVVAQFSLPLLARLKLLLFLLPALFQALMAAFVLLFLPQEMRPDAYAPPVYLWDQHWLWGVFISPVDSPSPV